LYLAAPCAAVNDLESVALPDEFDGAHRSETLGQTISRSSVIDMHRPQTEWAMVSIATVGER
jgi:hypothetical protein